MKFPSGAIEKFRRWCPPCLPLLRCEWRFENPINGYIILVGVNPRWMDCRPTQLFIQAQLMLHDLPKTHNFSVQLRVPLILPEALKAFKTTTTDIWSVLIRTLAYTTQFFKTILENLIVQVRAQLILHESLNDLSPRRTSWPQCAVQARFILHNPSRDLTFSLCIFEHSISCGPSEDLTVPSV